MDLFVAIKYPSRYKQNKKDTDYIKGKQKHLRNGSGKFGSKRNFYQQHHEQQQENKSVKFIEF